MSTKKCPDSGSESFSSWIIQPIFKLNLLSFLLGVLPCNDVGRTEGVHHTQNWSVKKLRGNLSEKVTSSFVVCVCEAFETWNCALS